MANKSDRRIELIKRMVKGHNRNIEKIGKAPKAAPLSAADKRAAKLQDLLSRWQSWKNLR